MMEIMKQQYSTILKMPYSKLRGALKWKADLEKKKADQLKDKNPGDKLPKSKQKLVY